VCAKLTEWGIPFHRGLAKTGVVATIQGNRELLHGKPTKAIGLRADMDALPMQELNQFGHKSRFEGKMHACGHDGHVAMLLGAAQYWAQPENRDFEGTVYLIFQPAEEGGGGARTMIAEGLFNHFPMEAVFGMHNWPGLAAGDFAVSSGPVMASSNEFHITVRGKGCHAAMPHLGIDPVVVAAQMIQAFQSIVSRNTKPVDAAVVSVTMLQAGEATNVIPDTCTLRGTVRTFSTEVLDQLESRMKEVAHHICLAHQAQCDFDFRRNYPPTINHPQACDLAREVMEQLVGSERVHPQEPTMGAEDFAYMLLEKPGCYCFIGNGDSLGTHRFPDHGAGPCTLHNPSYDFNDTIIPIGSSYWVRLVEHYFQKECA
jgi:hippurate hydrolase